MRYDILKLIDKNLTMKQIAKELNISEKELWVSIRNIIAYGYNLNLKYSIDSDINFVINKLEEDENKNSKKIFIPGDVKETRFIAISDLHIGDKDSNIKLANKVYNYAINNNISMILMCGDQIQGNFSKPMNMKVIDLQVDKFIKEYPYDKNILNYMILGNHDYRALHYSGFDISKRINNLRYDIIPIGNGIGNIALKDDFITLKHELECIDLDYDKMLGNIILSGHSHMMKIKLNGKLIICVPSLSYNSPDKSRENVPGFLDIIVEYERKKIGAININYLLLNPDIQKVSENKIKIKNINCN